MTPNQITTLLAENFDKELDIPFKLQLMDRVKYWRSRMVANSLQKEPQQRKFFRQSLFMQMHVVADIPIAPLIATQIAETVLQVPTMVRIGTTLFDYIGGPDGKSPFQEINPGTANYMSSGRFADMFPPYEYYNQKIRMEKFDQPLIRIDDIFDDPFKVNEINCTCGMAKVCDSWNMEFPISGDLLQLVIQSILQVDYNRPDKAQTKEIEV